MVIVNIWLPRHDENTKYMGHASMSVGPTYISWWPEEDRPGLGIDYHPIRNRDYQGDIEGEGGSEPDHRVFLEGLNENAILDWWRGFGLTDGKVVLQGPLPPYHLTKQDCSTVVATGLKKGGGDRFASWYSSWSAVWRPQTVLDYAVNIRAGLMRKR